MKPLEAWANISKRLARLEKIKTVLSIKEQSQEEYDADIQAEVICYKALKEMEERSKNENSR